MMMNNTLIFRTLLFITAMCCCYQVAVPAVARSKRSVVEIDNPEETLRILGTLAQRIIEAETFLSDKRGLDLGLSRGFSGSQAAKHLMGLSAASFANGPGRRRREAPSFN